MLFAIGGWDPYNVTEDADIGLRLARMGWRVGMITLPTAEEAPPTLAIWLKQRSRWFKGWFQVLLVHGRSPRHLRRELGPRRVVGFLLVHVGMVVSSLVHPLYLVLLFALATGRLTPWGDGGAFAAAVLAFSLFNLAAGYLAMRRLVANALARRGGGRLGATFYLGLPVYWLLMSLATYRALWQLVWRPHHWEKTPHGAAAAVSQRQVAGPMQQPAAGI